MTPTSTSLVIEDSNTIANDLKPIAGELRNAVVLVTGATGLIGFLVVLSLALLNKTECLGMTIIAMGRSLKKLKAKFHSYKFCQDVVFYEGDIRQPISFENKLTHIVHGACVTTSSYFVSHPVETIATAVIGTHNILELARKKDIRSMVFLSSLEIYGNLGRHNNAIRENEGGFIDPLNIRSSYSEGKRICETLCISYADEYDIPVKIARLSQTFGAGVDYNDKRVFAEFTRCALEGRDIILHSEGRTIRNYCYTADTVDAILRILLMGKNGEAYNVANEGAVVSIKEMAILVRDTLASKKIDIRVEIPEDVLSYGYNPEMTVKLDCTKLKTLGWRPQTSLPQMFQRMAEEFNYNR